MLSKKGSVTKTTDATTGGRRVFFFELPYWSSLLIRHNLDVIHIENNICESILGTLLKLDGKCKMGRMLGLTWSIYGYDQISTL
jgi:hypothetical protein